MRIDPVLLLVALVGCAPKTPPEPAAEPDPLAEPLPVDAGVRSGVLDNGLTWYVEQNAQPRDRAVLRLVVDAGSVLEDPDQLGLAHFLEHMAFNGTTHFPGNELITYLEGVGTQFGPHLNAHTSFDETVYKLTVPTDDAEVFDKAFVVLEDWAHGLAMTPEEIEKERGVVLEEWRTRLGPSRRIQEVTIPLTFHASPYAERLPIGTEASLTGFEHDALRRFYEDWYRPELMAVIVVGDVDPDAVQAKIEAHFSKIPASSEPRERARPPIPDHEQTLYGVVADPEIPRTTVSVLTKHDDVKGTTHRDYRDSLVDRVAANILDERLGDLARSADPPFLQGWAGRSRLSPTEGGHTLGARAAEGDALAAYEALLVELKRAEVHGFRPDELDRAVQRVLRSYERSLLEEDTTDSVRHAEEIIRVFTTGESMPGIAYETELARRWLPELTVDEVQAALEPWLGDSRVVQVIMPAKDGVAVPTEDDLKAVEARVAAMDVPPLEGAEIPDQLMAERPAPAEIVATDTSLAEATGFTGVTLANGVEVWYRDTDFSADEVRFTGFSPGGLSLVSDEDYVAGATATDVMHRSGFGDLDATLLRKWFAGKTLSLSHSIAGAWEYTWGSASPSDLEAALQMVHLSFTAPRFTEEGLTLDRQARTASLENRLLDPNAHFSDAWTRLRWPDDPRQAPWTVETLDGMDLERSRAVYTDRFGDAGDFTFVFAGALPDDFEALVQSYLGTLPSEGREETFRDRGFRAAGGVREETVTKGLDAKARVRIGFDGPLEEPGYLTRSRLYAMAEVLEVRLREELREERGGVYGVRVWVNVDQEPVDRYEVTIDFTCDPERVPELEEATFAVVDELRDAEVEGRYVTQVQEKNRRSREEDLRENRFWVGAVYGALQRGEDPIDAIVGYDERNSSLTAAEVHQAAVRWLDPGRYTHVRLLPEGPVAEGGAGEEAGGAEE